MKPVIICGGIGKKMWPLSRVEMPKHFIPLINGKSLYRLNYETLLKKFRPEEIFLQTTLDQADLAREQAPEIPKRNFFIEPELRDTGPAMGYMAAKLFNIDPDEPFTLVQADVLREPGEAYLKMIELCEKIVLEQGKLVTGGIRPSFVVEGVDYLKIEKKGKRANGMDYYKIKEYVDRAVGQEKLEDLLRRKLILTHCNHNTWTPRLLLEAFRKHTPDWYESIVEIAKMLGKSGQEGKIAREYSRMKKDRIERVTKKVFPDGYLVEVPYKWVDFGTWESMMKYQMETKTYRPGDDYLEIDSKNCYVRTRKGSKNFVALIGVSDLVVIDTDDALLVCHNDQTGRVGEVISHLKEKGKAEYL